MQAKKAARKKVRPSMLNRAQCSLPMCLQPVMPCLIAFQRLMGNKQELKEMMHDKLRKCRSSCAVYMKDLEKVVQKNEKSKKGDSSMQRYCTTPAPARN